MNLQAAQITEKKDLKWRFVGFLLHPALLSLIATLLVIFVLPTKYPKYLLVEIDKLNSESYQFKQWVFLDNNEVSDEINCLNNSIGKAGVIVRLNPLHQVQQWNFHGNFIFEHNAPLLTGDFDQNRMAEVYVFTQSSDSIFLHIISDFEHQDVAFTNRFISKVNVVNGTTDPYIVPAEMEDLNEDGFKELIFGIGTGYSVYPRKIYAYDVVNDTLLQSDENLFSINNILQADIDGDGKNEFFPMGSSTGNISDSSFRYHDYSCWLMAHDRKLKFLFNPIESPGKHGGLTLHSIKAQDSKNQLIGIHNDVTIKNSCEIFTVNKEGQKTNSKRFSHIFNNSFVIPYRGNEAIVCVANKDSAIIIDKSLNVMSYLRLKFYPENHLFYDLDGDGNNEWIFVNFLKDQLVVTRDLFRHPAFAKINFDDRLKTTVSFKEVPGKRPVIFVNTGKYDYYYEYKPNPMYYTRFGIYAGIYLGLFLFSLLIRKIQRSQMQRRYQAEKKITELQLKIVRNQMDPHFAMNAITSVISAIGQNKTEEASQHLHSFAKLYRHLVLTSDSITCKLKKELEFTENYIKMMQFRFTDKFSYEKDIPPEIVASGIEIPKMLIQSQVENAIRHGLLPRNGGGVLSLVISRQDSLLKITVTDNGVGRQRAREAGETSTGKGNKMVQEFLALYQKITGQQVSYEVHDLYDEQGQPAGTRVEMLISLPPTTLKP